MFGLEQVFPAFVTNDYKSFCGPQEVLTRLKTEGNKVANQGLAQFDGIRLVFLKLGTTAGHQGL